MSASPVSSSPQSYYDVSRSPDSAEQFYTPQDPPTAPSTEERDLEKHMEKRRDFMQMNAAWETTPMQSSKPRVLSKNAAPKALFKEENSKVNPPRATNGHEGCCIIV